MDNNLKLVVVIINHDIEQDIIEKMKKCSARGFTVLNGEGMAKMSLLEIFGLFDHSKKIILSAITEDRERELMQMLDGELINKNRTLGVAFSIDIEGYMGAKALFNQALLK